MAKHFRVTIEPFEKTGGFVIMAYIGSETYRAHVCREPGVPSFHILWRLAEAFRSLAEAVCQND